MSIDPDALARGVAAATARRTSRRGFLARVALAASALVVSPMSLFTRPAYASCGQSAGLCGSPNCDCNGETDADGYTAFCCVLTGHNSCPSGTFIGGYWKCSNYQGSGYCANNGGVRWYLDCNIMPGAACDCRCANGDCNQRRTCCNKFRYPGCNQQITQVTCIKCRIVRCGKPWNTWPSECTSPGSGGPCSDNNTCTHDAACLNNIP